MWMCVPLVYHMPTGSLGACDAQRMHRRQLRDPSATMSSRTRGSHHCRLIGMRWTRPRAEKLSGPLEASSELMSARTRAWLGTRLRNSQNKSCPRVVDEAARARGDVHVHSAGASGGGEHAFRAFRYALVADDDPKDVPPPLPSLHSKVDAHHAQGRVLVNLEGAGSAPQQVAETKCSDAPPIRAMPHTY